MAVLPQEIQVWYVLPALRRELAIALIRRHSMPQKKVASIMGLSEGAVSQYLSSKRGTSVKFGSGVIKEIEVSAKRISDDNSAAMDELIRLSGLGKVKQTICRLHMDQDSSVAKGCDICFRHSAF